MLPKGAANSHIRSFCRIQNVPRNFFKQQEQFNRINNINNNSERNLEHAMPTEKQAIGKMNVQSPNTLFPATEETSQGLKDSHIFCCFKLLDFRSCPRTYDDDFSRISLRKHQHAKTSDVAEKILNINKILKSDEIVKIILMEEEFYWKYTLKVNTIILDILENSYKIP